MIMHSAKKYILFLLVSFVCVQVNAQDEYPPNAKPGTCYLQVYTPNEYEYKEVTEIDRPAYTKSISIPAIYEYVYDTLVLRPAEKRLEVVAETYTTVIETVLVAPPTTRWETGKIDPNCLSTNPADCRVVCLVEVPAKYTTYTRKVLETPSYTREVNIPAEIKIATKRILKTPAGVMDYEVPATYKTVMKRQLVKKGFIDWKEVICSDQINIELVKKVQEALTDKGYDAGPVDGAWGGKSLDAMNKVQGEKNLPITKVISLETLQALGVQR
jgi:hypothetical protein